MIHDTYTKALRNTQQFLACMHRHTPMSTQNKHFIYMYIDKLKYTPACRKYNQGTVCYVGAVFQDMDEADPWGRVLRAAVRM